MTDLDAATRVQIQAEKFLGVERRLAVVTPMSNREYAVSVLRASLQGNYEMRRKSDDPARELLQKIAFELLQKMTPEERERLQGFMPAQEAIADIDPNRSTVDVTMGQVTLKSDPRVAQRFKKQQERAISAGKLDPRFSSLAQFVDSDPDTASS